MFLIVLSVLGDWLIEDQSFVKNSWKDKFNIFLIYFEHIVELLNHWGLEKLRCQEKINSLKWTWFCTLFFPPRFLQFINISDGEGEADAIKQKLDTAFSNFYTVEETVTGVEGYQGSEDLRGQDSGKKGIAEKWKQYSRSLSYQGCWRICKMYSQIILKAE